MYGYLGHPTAAAQECSNDQVRLVDGATATEGRVEICLEGEWGTVCDHNWGALDARVACRQLQLPYEREYNIQQICVVLTTKGEMFFQTLMLSTATEAVKDQFTTPDFSVLGMRQV